MKMAGTSAGSINTLLLNAVYTKEEAELLKKNNKPINDITYYETRSEKVLDYLAHKDLAELVDGHPLWRKLILGVFSPSAGGGIKGQLSTFKMAIKTGVVLFLVFLLSALCLAFYTAHNDTWLVLRWVSIIAAVGLIIIIAYFITRAVLVRLLYKHAEKFGINPGKNFEDWLVKILEENGIESVDALTQKLKDEKEVLKPRIQHCTYTQSAAQPPEDDVIYAD